MAVNEWKVIVVNEKLLPIYQLTETREFSLNLALNRIDTAQFTLRVDDAFVPYLDDLNYYLKIYLNNNLIFFGPMVGYEETFDGREGGVTVNCASPAWFLQYRFPNKTTGSVLANNGTVTDRAVICAQLIESLKFQFAYDTSSDPSGAISSYDEDTSGLALDLTYRPYGWTGIGTSDTVSSGSSIQYGVVPYKSMLEIINELSASTVGFDWRIEPNENFTGDMTIYSLLMGRFTASPVIGEDRPDVVFQMGEGLINMKSYTRAITRQDQATNVQHLLPANSEPSPPRTFDLPSALTWGVMDAVAQADITDFTLRQQLVDAHIAARSFPRQTISFQPRSRLESDAIPVFGQDYELGDVVRGHAKVADQTRFNGLFRVHGVSFSVTAGGETQNLVLTPGE